MYGCGTYGLELSNVEQLTAINCDIYDCSYGAIQAWGCWNLQFINCTFRDMECLSAIDLLSSHHVTFEDSSFSAINTGHSSNPEYPAPFLELRYNTDLTFLRTEFTNNVADVLMSSWTAGTTFTDCTFTGNSFSAP